MEPLLLDGLKAIMTIARIVDAKDEYTKGHSVRVAGYSELFAKELGWSEAEIQTLRCAALLHDIGKIAIPDSILNKPGRLTGQEYAIIQRHTVIGEEIVRDISELPYIRQAARSHHERWDGSGYPDGLRGDQIPQVAQIIGISDSFDAMNSSRVYRERLDPSEIRGIMLEGRSQQFAPGLLDTFISLLDSGKLKLSLEDENTEEEDGGAGSRVIRLVGENWSSGEEKDFLTGLWNRRRGEQLIRRGMAEKGGSLLFIDLDNLKFVNDIYGHLAGDQALRIIGAILKRQEQGIACRIGGDEFLLFLPEKTAAEGEKTAELLCGTFAEEKDYLKETSLSIGLFSFRADEYTYEEALNRADKALYHVKQNGKGGYYHYLEKNMKGENASSVDLDNLVKALKLQGQYRGAYNVNNREFSHLYHFISSMAERYEYRVDLLIITSTPKADRAITIEEQENVQLCLDKALRETLRNVDVCTRFSGMQYLVILTNARVDSVQMIMDRVFKRFLRIYAKDDIMLSYDSAEYPSFE